jgi:hypothetical protein
MDLLGVRAELAFAADPCSCLDAPRPLVKPLGAPPAVLLIAPPLDFDRRSGDMERGRLAARRETEMDNLIARVASAAGVPPDTARQAVSLVVDFIKREAPEEAVDRLLAQAPALNAIAASGQASSGEGMGRVVKGLMGVAAGAMGGGGIMALGANLMALGLDMGQIQTVGKEVFAYAREIAGDEVVGEITAAIPGLSQYI